VVAAVALNDGRRVCTMNRSGEIDMWDIVDQSKVKSFGKKSPMEEIVKRYDSEISVPKWFTIDLHLGSLGVVLQRCSAFSAELWAQVITFTISLSG
jgi:hypothetical protein